MSSEQRSANRGLVENFLRQWRKPYGIQTICDMTGVSTKLAEAVVAEWIREGKAVEMEPGIYRVTGNRVVRNSASEWNYVAEVGRMIVEMIRRFPYRSIRSLARDMGVSRTYIQKYLQALVSMGAVSWDGIQYVSVKDVDYNRLGCDIQPLAIRKLRRNYECG